MICKWKTDCARCGETIEEGDDLFMVDGITGLKEKICSLCLWMDGQQCECGNQKKQEHETCYPCRVEQEKADGLRCECGKPKKPQYATCYSCKMEVTQ